MPVFSLPSNCGIGTLGKGAYDFVRFLNETGQKYWQILPIGPPACADSPYMSYSSRAGNPYLIDLDWLVGDGWLDKQDLKDAGIKKAKKDKKNAEKFSSPFPSGKINYAQIAKSRKKIFKRLFSNFIKQIPDDYNAFCLEHSEWLNDYALFMALLEDLNYASLEKWPDMYKYRDTNALESYINKHEEQIIYHKMLQYFFYKQWRSLQNFARKNNVKIIGDIPLYVALTSADTWVDPQIFKLDHNLELSIVSGCPPNKSRGKKNKGQTWGTPVYDWQYLKKQNYSWWIKRIRDALDLYDIIRIDHFKGFEKFYNINAKNPDPKKGYWQKGPGIDFWNNVAEALGFNKVSDLPIFAEDLGIITKSLNKLLKDCGFDGMSVLEFAFNAKAKMYKYRGGKQKYLPHNIETNKICYIGSHDTDTLMGWLDNLEQIQIDNLYTYYGTKNKNKLFVLLFSDAMFCKANTCILAAQDLLKLSSDARCNTPGTVNINWMWQMTNKEFKNLPKKTLYKLTKLSERI